LSLTNIALIIVVIKLAYVEQANMLDLGTLLLALANYNIKKYWVKGSLSTNMTSIQQDIKKVIVNSSKSGSLGSQSEEDSEDIEI
jgi:hypothetical protein